MYYTEPTLSEFLASVNIVKGPKVPRDDSKTRVSSKTAGIDLTFEEEGFIDSPPKSYPDGALVLTSINFQGSATKTHAAFAGTLPQGLKLAMGKEEVTRLLGLPQDSDDYLNLCRWDIDDKWMFVDFTNQDTIRSVGIQLRNKNIL